MRVKRMASFLCAVCLQLGFGLAAMAASAPSSMLIRSQPSGPSNIVFRIGTFDGSSSEFNGGAPSQLVDYIVGKSQAAQDWYATQPAPADAETGQAAGDVKSAPRAIAFSLAGTPAPTYRIHIALLSVAARIPALRVSINGKQGVFFLHLMHSDADIAASNIWPYGSSHEDITFSFPGTYLHAGENRITLQVIANADGMHDEAWLTFDALELDWSKESWNGNAFSALIEPTVFYPQEKGPLRELVDVFIRYQKPVQPGSEVGLRLATQHYSQRLRGGQDFGEERLEFRVIEFPAKTRAELQWAVAGKMQHNEQTIDPEKKWTLFVVPHTHLDIGYTDYQAKVAAIHSRVIDEALDLIDQNPDFRFTLDGEWSLGQFLNTRAPTQQQRAIEAIRKKELLVPANYANLLTGFPTAEILIRSLYPSANLSRVYGTPFDYASITDVPSYSWSYASVLAAAGIRDFLAGGNSIRAPGLQQGRLNEDSPMWWQGPDGQKVFFWDAFGYTQMDALLSVPAAAAVDYDSIPLFLKQYERPEYRASAAIVYGSQVENTNLKPQQASVVQEWNRVYAYPHLQYSGIHEALESIAAQFGDAISTIRGDGGPLWEDGIAADATYAAIERLNENSAPSAEKLATLAALVNPLMAANKANLDRMWTNMVLMDEHTFDADISSDEPTSEEAIGQSTVKQRYAGEARALSNFVARNSMASLVSSISAGPGSLVVFNTLNWIRSGDVFVDIKTGDELMDVSDRKIVPMEVISSGKYFCHVRFRAQDIPAVGYKVFQMQPEHIGSAAPEAAHTTMIESPYYRVTLDPVTGAVRSIYDIQLHRELVNQQGPYRFGQYLYVTGGDQAPNTILQYSLTDSQPKLEIHPAHDGSVVSVVKTPSGWAAHMKSCDVNTPKIETEIRLFDQEKKIEIIEDVDKEEVHTKEAVYFAFPFAMDDPEFQYEIQNGVVDPAKDMYPGAGHEWFSVQHWVAVQQDGISGAVMPLDAPLVTLGDINRGAWPSHFGERPGTVFSYAMNNYWFTNYASGQGGHFRFRYIVTSAPSTNAADLSRMGWEEVTQLEKDIVIAQDKSFGPPPPLDGIQGSFLDVQDPEILLETWKPAEDGRGTILRFLDLGGDTRTVTVRTPLLDFSEAWQSDAVERDKKPLSLLGKSAFQFVVHPHEIVTVRIVGSVTTPAPAI